MPFLEDEALDSGLQFLGIFWVGLLGPLAERRALLLNDFKLSSLLLDLLFEHSPLSLTISEHLLELGIALARFLPLFG